jgi:hypothetical protein
MPRLSGDDRKRGTRRRPSGVSRIVLSLLATGLGVAAVWLIVTADSTKMTKVGALLGFWALLIAAYPLLGARTPDPVSGTELDLRPSGGLERTEDAAARLEYERQLHQMIREEVRSLGAEVVGLRAEVSALRTAILEQVGGQIRLERIETTRMIGSDLEALQHEVRQLNVARQAEAQPRVLDQPIAESGYTGRRRRVEPAFEEVGRHSGRHAAAEPAVASGASTGGRRRRQDDDDDILARILEREGARR